jgi:predicted Zn-dependent protease
MSESELLTKKRCWELFDIALRAARSAGTPDVEVILAATSAALTRFANNTIHQNVAERTRHLSVRALLDHRTARATTNRFDETSIRSAVEQSVAIARSQTPDPDLLPLIEPSRTAHVERFRDSTARSTPAARATAVAEAIRVAEAAAQTAAGIYAASQSVEAILNSRGVFSYYHDTLAQFSMTATAKDSSGWAKQTSAGCDDFDPVALARQASNKATLSAAPRELEPGRYTVILGPAAVLDLVGQMFGDFSATALKDQRSFLSGRMGKKLFGENITIYDDVYHPAQLGPPFDGEGLPRRRLALVDKGVIRNIAYCRTAAQREGVEPTGHGFPLPNEFGEAPLNIVIEGENSSVEEMIAATSQGILVTRLWYIREVDPYEKIMTGMTRDGTFLVENGEIVCGLKNFRFNEILVEMLGRVEALSPAVRASGEEAFDMVVPAMKVRDFHFTEVTRF